MHPKQSHNNGPRKPYHSHSSSHSSAPRSGGFSRPQAGFSSGNFRSNPQPSRFGGSSSGSSRFGGHSSGPRRFGSGRPQGAQGGSRPHFGRRSGSRGGGERIDTARFINKAVITEEVEHFVPEHAFTDFKIDAELKASVVAKGYTTPTPIQDRAIPHILNGSDIVGIANTGTGKTAAFLIPLIQKVRLNRKEQVMVLAPTRELAMQIDEELKILTKGMKMFSVCCVGGAPIGKQLRDLRFQYNFIIGTPGRVKDLIERKMIHLHEFNSIVLDEADRMLDMGFVNDMRLIMKGMPQKRHTLFFSATISGEIEKLIKEFLHEPVRISVKTRDTAKSVDQDVVRVRGADKLDTLHDLLNQKEFNKVLIFGRTKHGVEKLTKLLNQKGFKAESIHGNKNQSQRVRALDAFKKSHAQILVATDVAARGLDIPDVSHVINYELPATYDDYVHRIGRTGRGGKKGKALTFIE
ncbi:MAG: DEAD/DEAH box helicase [Candidatus Pacebacteria bacterium]|nr:DEAD/DEAH box helicase [Candidatus Paceibacterota bacterium]